MRARGAADGRDAAARGRARRRPRRPRRRRRATRRRSHASSTRPSAGWSRRPPASARATCSSTRPAGCGRTSPRSRRAWTSRPSRQSPTDELGPQRHRARQAAHRGARAGRPVRRQPRDGRVHPDRRAHARHRRRRDGRGHARGRRGGARALARHPLAPERAGALGALVLDRPARRDGLADRAAGVGQVDDRGRGRARAGRVRPLRLPARRRQPPPRALGRPRLRSGLALGEHPPRGARRAAVRRRGRGGGRLARLPVPRGPAQRPPAARGGGARRSWRCSSTRRSRSARGATRRGSTPGPAPAG